MSRFSTANAPAGHFRVYCRSEVDAKTFSVITNDPEFIFEPVSDEHHRLSQTLIKRKLSVSYWSTREPGSPLECRFWKLSVGFLGAFALRKETTSFAMPVCPSAWDNSAPLGGFS